MQKKELNGWIQDLRDLGKIKFLMLRQGSNLLQVIIKDESLFEEFKTLSKESAVKVTGIVQKTEKTRAGVEVIAEKIEVLSKSASLPISIEEKGEDKTGQQKRLDFRSLDLRKRKSQLIFNVQSAILEGIYKHVFQKGFQQVFTPCILGTSSEGGSEVFPIIYFDKEGFLRQDPQLHRQLAIAGGFSKIFEIGPAWRAENSHTTKHLCEHRVCAVEMAFIKDEYEVIKLEEELIVSIIETVMEKCGKEVKEVFGIALEKPRQPFPVLEFPNVYQIIKQRGKALGEGSDLDAESEKILAEYAKEEFGSDFFFVNKFPFKIKPFYVMKDNATYARSVDLYFKGLELSSGGQREHRFEKILGSIKEKGLSKDELEWFTKFFQFGVPPHGGFAIGIERLTKALLGIENIRDCVLFPRDTERLVP